MYAGSGGEDGYIGSLQSYSGISGSGHPAYVGWKYTVADTLEGSRANTTKSLAYQTVENWYNNLGSYKNYIDTGAIYCSNREGSGSWPRTFDYSYVRRTSGNYPTLECNTGDRFYTFGLMTEDELVYAGGVPNKVNVETYYYLNAQNGSSSGGYSWWTMSPYRYVGLGAAYLTVVVGTNGYAASADKVDAGRVDRCPGNYADYDVIRPVISLKSTVQVTGGNGTSENPYIVTYN